MDERRSPDKINSKLPVCHFQRPVVAFLDAHVSERTQTSVSSSLSCFGRVKDQPTPYPRTDVVIQHIKRDELFSLAAQRTPTQSPATMCWAREGRRDRYRHTLYYACPVAMQAPPCWRL